MAERVSVRLAGLSLALALSACGGTTDETGPGSSSAPAGGGDVGISWWHNSNTGAGKGY